LLSTGADAQDTSVESPETRYAATVDGISIAYQVLGDGPVDLVYAPGLWSNVEMMWELPAWAHFLRRLASFSRLVVFDMRGVGLSDRGAERPTIELQRDDIAAVMDAVGMRKGFVIGHTRSASMAMLFAATHPERTDGLVLYSPVAKSISAPDFPHGLREKEMTAFVERFVHDAGTGRNVQIFAPSVASDEGFVKWWARFERMVASPSAFRELGNILIEIDLRRVLPAIHVPTLVLHRDREAVTLTSQARDVAERIDGAIYVELPGIDLLPFIGDADAVVDEIQEFVTGVRPAPETDKVLATLLFTDIVGSTEKQAELGDRGWKELVQRHHALVRELLERFRGMEQDTAGDGFYARFDGPARAVACAQEIVRAVDGLGIRVRAGVHTGECEVVDGKCSGLSVSIGARVAALAGPSEVLVSQTVKDLVVGSDLALTDAGEHELKGVPDRWHLYRVTK
jgi:class 3 adenylate cyclase/pimeloyl-ACP methyl ester carboxylesterase